MHYALGVVIIEFQLNMSASLKDKRTEIKGLIRKLSNKFNVSLAEIAYQDLWQRCGIGVTCISSERAIADAVLEQAIRFVEENINGNILEIRKEHF
ncbi:MAG: DUF503 domain-containing protein [bacterium]|nr:DUF503 domain-containing protein [bacterium]